METNITTHAFKFAGVKYFRGKAENVQIGSYGEKKDPIGAKAHLDIQNQVNRKHLKGKVRYITTANINWSKEKRGEVEVNGSLQYFTLNGKASINASYNGVKKANLKLAKLAIDEGPLTRMLNNSANGARNYLSKEGKDGRIVSEVWILMEGELSEQFESAASITVEASDVDKSLDVTASGGIKGKSTITLSKGTTFAYLMHKVKDWNKGKTRIEDLEADYKGMN